MILLVLLMIAFIYANCYKTKRSLHMLQQNLYDENHRYIKWIFRNKELFLGLELFLIGISILELFHILNLEFVSLLLQWLIFFFLILIGLRMKKKIALDQNKKKLVYTARIKRLIVTIMILFIIPIIFFYQNRWILILVYSGMTYFNCFIVLKTL